MRKFADENSSESIDNKEIGKFACLSKLPMNQNHVNKIARGILKPNMIVLYNAPNTKKIKEALLYLIKIFLMFR